MSAPDRRQLIERDSGKLSVRRQCALLGLARSGVYRPPTPANDNDLALMRRIDELFTAWPFLGSRRMTAMLRADGHDINRKRVRRLMRVMGLEAIYQRPNTSRRHPEHRVYPYLLRGLIVDRPNQVWCADITLDPLRGSSPDGTGLRVSGRGHGLVQPSRAGVAAVDHDGLGLLR